MTCEAKLTIDEIEKLVSSIQNSGTSTANTRIMRQLLDEIKRLKKEINELQIKATANAR